MRGFLRWLALRVTVSPHPRQLYPDTGNSADNHRGEVGFTQNLCVSFANPIAKSVD
jgi:hypothetical protein